MPPQISASQALEYERDADGGEHQAHDIGLGDRSEGDAVRQAAEQEAEGDGQHERERIVHAHLDMQHPGDEAGEHEEFALGEIDDARGLVHHHEPSATRA